MWEPDNKISVDQKVTTSTTKFLFLEGFKMYNSGSLEGLYVEIVVKI
jgi:hypothetical protein